MADDTVQKYAPVVALGLGAVAALYLWRSNKAAGSDMQKCNKDTSEEEEPKKKSRKIEKRNKDKNEEEEPKKRSRKDKSKTKEQKVNVRARVRALSRVLVHFYISHKHHNVPYSNTN